MFLDNMLELLKDNNGVTARKASEKLFLRGRTPKLLWKEKGKKIYNRSVKNSLKNPQ